MTVVLCSYISTGIVGFLGYLKTLYLLYMLYRLEWLLNVYIEFCVGKDSEKDNSGLLEICEGILENIWKISSV
jgi:hypothetical protein